MYLTQHMLSILISLGRFRGACAGNYSFTRSCVHNLKVIHEGRPLILSPQGFFVTAKRYYIILYFMMLYYIILYSIMQPTFSDFPVLLKFMYIINQ